MAADGPRHAIGHGPNDVLGAWVRDRLPARNRAVLARAQSVDDLVAELATVVLPAVPDADTLAPRAACAQIVELGLIGASVARHRQERDLGLLATPERSLDGLVVGRAQLPLAQHLARLSARSGSGHPSRDAYASLVRWNAPPVQVRWRGRGLLDLPSVFDDGVVRTYTGAADETLFITLLKRAEALEHAANACLAPIATGDRPLDHPDTGDALAEATALLHAVHRINLAFTEAGPDGRPMFGSDHFLDVLRQFAVHWQRGDVPPSGAQDPEFLKRDFYLDLDFPDYRRHVQRVYPALLAHERDEIDSAARAPGLPTLLAARLGVPLAALADSDDAQARALLARHRWLADYVLLYRANAWVAASHLMLTKRFLFKPMQARVRAGIADSPLVSNHAGTTGLLEALLETLAGARIRHRLAALARLAPELLQAASPRAAATLARCSDSAQLPEAVMASAASPQVGVTPSAGQSWAAAQA